MNDLHRVFSGIQPTGTVHIGNYLGAIRNWVFLQEQYDSFFCIVDYHSITIPYDPAQLPDLVIDAVASNIAAGLDPEKATIFVQSHVPEHTELSWLFTCITPMGNLQRMTQFKEKSRQHEENINAGLLYYPVLQAADILLYKADLVPVGEDQVQHLELTRDVARKFNSTFGETFPEAKPYLTKTARIMALNDPERKMSKSLPGSYVSLSDEPDVIRDKVRKAVTDVGPRGAEMSPGVRNLFLLLEAFTTPETVQEFRTSYDAGQLRYVDLKQAVAEGMIKTLKPIRERRKELLAHPSTVREVLAAGADRARRIARETIAEAKEKMGFVIPS